MKLFRTDIDPRCLYCDKGRSVGRGEIGCVYRGIVKEYFHCRRFVYDPLRRVPPKPAALNADFKPEDFAV